MQAGGTRRLKNLLHLVSIVVAVVVLSGTKPSALRIFLQKLFYSADNDGVKMPLELHCFVDSLRRHTPQNKTMTDEMFFARQVFKGEFRFAAKKARQRWRFAHDTLFQSRRFLQLREGTLCKARRRQAGKGKGLS
jgi:hypothetical protein